MMIRASAGEGVVAVCKEGLDEQGQARGRLQVTKSPPVVLVAAASCVCVCV